MGIYDLYDFGGKIQEEWEAEHEFWEVPPLKPEVAERRQAIEQARLEKLRAERKIESRRNDLRKKARLHLATLIKRDGEFCQRCGTTENLTVDHVVALANGGSNELDNLQLLCNRCNVAKGARV